MSVSPPHPPRFTPEAAQAYRDAIRDAGGVEVFAVGRLDADGRVAEIEVHCRGNESAVPALLRAPRSGEVVIHNHPSGVLRASEPDLYLAGRYGEDGVGMVITDSPVTRELWVVEPQRRLRVQVSPDRVRAFFEEALPRAVPGWETRGGQLDMALAVLDALQAGHKDHPVVAALEAGTGTGKSLAYLVPAAMWAEANEARVAIATYTITLQGQLAASDLPLLGRAGLEVETAVLQGRSNYICRRRLAEAVEDLDQDRAEAAAAAGDDPESRDLAAAEGPTEAAIRRVAEWAEAHRRGSRTDLGFPVPEDAWERIYSDHDQTLRARCPHFGRCLYYEARRDAARARLVVVNQHLLLADLVVKQETGGDGILPRFDRVIVDEAHHLEDAATGLLGSELTALAVTRAAAPLLSRRKRRGALARIKTRYAPELDPDARGRLLGACDLMETELTAMTEEVPAAMTAMAEEVARLPADPGGSEAPGDRSLRLTDQLRAQPAWTHHLGPAISDLSGRLDRAAARLSALERLLDALPEDVIERSPQPLLDLRRTRARLESKAAVAAAMGRADPEQVQWIGPARRRRGPPQALLAQAPIDVGPTLRRHLFSRMETTVLTSATLTVHDSFAHFRGRLGLPAPATDTHPADTRPADARPADARPADAPPGPPPRGHAGPVPTAHDVDLDADADRGWLDVRTGIFPSPFDYSHQALLGLPRDFPPPDDRRFLPWARRFVVQAVRASGGGAFVLCTSYALVDDLHAAARAELGDRFLLLKQGEAGRSHLLRRFRERGDAVLFGTDSFWEGVSVAGDALRLVIIPRLPFRVPTEPVQQARHERLEAQGLDPFRAWALPQAVLRLRQGFGRLVRTREDRGAVVILDRRVHERWYGRVFLSSLPPARRVTGPARAVLERLREFYAPATIPSPAGPPAPRPETP